MDDRDAPSPDELRHEVEALRAENRRLRALLGSDVPEPATAHRCRQRLPGSPRSSTIHRGPPTVCAVDGRASPEAKIALFRSLFAGRDDVYAARWENERTRKSGWSPAVVGGPANARRPDREYVPLGDGVIEAHLAGRVHVGLYPLLRDDACRLLACDFDGPGWPLDARRLRRRRPGRRHPGGAGALAVRRRRARLDVLQRAGASICRPAGRRVPAARGDDRAGRDSTWPATTGCSRRRTSCRRDRSAT